LEQDHWKSAYSLRTDDFGKRLIALLVFKLLSATTTAKRLQVIRFHKNKTLLVLTLTVGLGFVN